MTQQDFVPSFCISVTTMFRIATRHLLSRPVAPILHRPLSTSSSLLRKSYSPEQTDVNPSPAPRPPPIPEEVSPSSPALEPIEPIILSEAPSTPPNDIYQSPSQSTAPPPTPSPILPTTTSPADTDYSTLPSLSLAVDSQPQISGPDLKGGRTGAGKKEYVSSIERQRRLLLRWSLAGLILGGFGYVYAMGDDEVSGLKVL
jgi:import inner membrane translocase subunit TIM50